MSYNRLAFFLSQVISGHHLLSELWKCVGFLGTFLMEIISHMICIGFLSTFHSYCDLSDLCSMQILFHIDNRTGMLLPLFMHITL